MFTHLTPHTHTPRHKFTHLYNKYIYIYIVVTTNLPSSSEFGMNHAKRKKGFTVSPTTSVLFSKVILCFMRGKITKIISFRGLKVW